MSGDITCGGSLNIVNSGSPYASLTYLNINNYSNIIGIQFGYVSFGYINSEFYFGFNYNFPTDNIYIIFTPFVNSSTSSAVITFSIVEITSFGCTVMCSSNVSGAPYACPFNWMAICIA